MQVNMCAIKIGLEGFFVMFIPADQNVVSTNEVKKILGLENGG